MNDAKNILIAWLSAGSPLVAAAASETGVTILSAVVLPIFFFTIGKAIDVMLQVYLSGRNASVNERASDTGKAIDSSSSSASSSPVVKPSEEKQTTEEEDKDEQEGREKRC